MSLVYICHPGLHNEILSLWGGGGEEEEEEEKKKEKKAGISRGLSPRPHTHEVGTELLHKTAFLYITYPILCIFRILFIT